MVWALILFLGVPGWHWGGMPSGPLLNYNWSYNPYKFVYNPQCSTHLFFAISPWSLHLWLVTRSPPYGIPISLSVAFRWQGSMPVLSVTIPWVFLPRDLSKTSRISARCRVGTLRVPDFCLGGFFLHLVDFYGKCRQIYYRWMVWDIGMS